jgi:hypothetical protein
MAYPEGQLTSQWTDALRAPVTVRVSRTTAVDRDQSSARFETRKSIGAGLAAVARGNPWDRGTGRATYSGLPPTHSSLAWSHRHRSLAFLGVPLPALRRTVSLSLRCRPTIDAPVRPLWLGPGR